MEKRKDAAYLERNKVVALLARCFPSGLAKTAIEGWSEDWHGCVYIDLPNGQVSWHFHDSQAYLFLGLPPYTGKWDGHDTEEKYARVAGCVVAPRGLSEEQTKTLARFRELMRQHVHDPTVCVDGDDCLETKLLEIICPSEEG